MADQNFSSQLPPQGLVPCFRCGAMNYPQASKCWVCLTPVSTEQPIMAEQVQQPPMFASQGLQYFTCILVPILLAVAFFGSIMGGEMVGQVAAGAALLTACVTIGIGISRKQLGGALLSLLISVSVGILVITAIVFALFVLLFIACINAIQ